MRDAEFNWVTGRAACSIESLFDRLETALNQDKDTIRKIRQASGGYRLGFDCTRDRNVITVSRTDTTVDETKRSVVKFTLSKSDIIVSRDDRQQFRIVPSFGTDGECRMAVNGEDLETWQVCRKAVDELFFS